MDVTVIIPTLYGKGDEYAQLCIKSLLNTTNWPIIHVINGAPMHTQLRGRVSVITMKAQGQCIAVNRAAKLAQTEYLFITNDDMYYAPGWNKNLRDSYICASPNLIEPTDNAGSAQPFLKFNGGLTLEAFKQKEVDMFVRDLVDAPIEAKVEFGFNFPVLIKSDLWRLIDGYDEHYDPWGSNSDTDLQTKIELAGVQPMRLRDVPVYHFSNKSGTFDGTHQEEWWRNFNYYRDKWGFTRDDEPLPDTWYARDLVNKEKNIYHPPWEQQYGR